MKETVRKLVIELKEKDLTIALAESVTCGLATHQLNIVKGTSDVLMGSIICYNEKVKSDLLCVRPGIIKKFSAESQEVTNEMVKNLKKIFKADCYAALTGLASPGASQKKGKPVGTIFFSVMYKGKIFEQRKKFNGPPLEVKRKGCESLYQFIYKVISTH